MNSRPRIASRSSGCLSRGTKGGPFVSCLHYLRCVSEYFFAEEDYCVYLDHLAELAERFECSVDKQSRLTVAHSWTGRWPALLMKHPGQRYLQYVNRTYKLCGTLRQGRFRSWLTQTEDYVLACYRYIELSPVRANMACHPRDYKWSSYRAHAEGKERCPAQPPRAGLPPGPDLGEPPRNKAYN